MAHFHAMPVLLVKQPLQEGGWAWVPETPWGGIKSVTVPTSGPEGGTVPALVETDADQGDWHDETHIRGGRDVKRRG